MAVTYNRHKKKMNADKEIEIRIASPKESVIRFIPSPHYPSNFGAYFAEKDAEALANFFLKELPVMTLLRLSLKLNRAFRPTL